MTLQGLALLALVFGDIGFDHPGRFGLEFDHGVLLALLWFGSSCVGFMVARGRKQSGLLKLQALVFSLSVCVCLVIMALG